MTDKTALRHLIEDCEAGTALFKSFPAVFTSVGTDCVYDAYKAYKGSLDAAKALHDAMLPGWGAQPRILSSGAGADCLIWLHPAPQVHAKADTPARAWLIAILKAYEAQQ